MGDDLEAFASFCFLSAPEKTRIADRLRSKGWAEAVQKVKELQADLILLDEGLSKLNGIGVARQIAKLAPEPKNVIAGL